MTFTAALETGLSIFIDQKPKYKRMLEAKAPLILSECSFHTDGHAEFWKELRRCYREAIIKAMSIFDSQAIKKEGSVDDSNCIDLTEEDKPKRHRHLIPNQNRYESWHKKTRRPLPKKKQATVNNIFILGSEPSQEQLMRLKGFLSGRNGGHEL